MSARTRSIKPSRKRISGPAEYEPPPAPDDDLNLTDVDLAYWRDELR